MKTMITLRAASMVFTLGHAEVRVWAPMAPPYNGGANGDLAARDIWGAG
jgi:hypothetical protein